MAVDVLRDANGFHHAPLVGCTIGFCSLLRSEANCSTLD